MNATFSKTFLWVAIGSILCLSIVVLHSFFMRTAAEDAAEAIIARRVLPRYAIVFEGRTNVINCCESLKTFSLQHEMMPYLIIAAPYIEHYNNPTNYPIFISETDERVIIELPSRYRLPPYNLKVYWGSFYLFKMEIDKKTKKVISALQG